MPNGTNGARATLELKPWQRYAAAGFGVLMLLIALVYGLVPRYELVAAANCDSAPAGCTVVATAHPLSAIVVAFLVLAAIALLIGLAGRIPSFEFGGITATTNAALVKATLSADSKSKTRTRSESAAGDAVTVRARARDLYVSLPPRIRAAADLTWSAEFPDSLLLESIVGLSHIGDQWVIGAQSASGKSFTLTVEPAAEGDGSPRLSLL